MATLTSASVAVPRGTLNHPPRRGPCFAGASRRQLVADMLMVAAWGTLIPGLLWFGHWMGF